jgi:hypothetical protein
MKRQTNSLPKLTGLRSWDIGIILINMLLAINGVMFIVVMFNFLKWGAERVIYDNGSDKAVTFNEYSSKNFFIYNVPIIFVGGISLMTSFTNFSMRFCYKQKYKTQLILQMGLVVCLFVSHLSFLAFTLAWWPNLEKNYHRSLQETVKIIGEQRNQYLETECGFMRELSQQFSCCGYDIKDAYVVGWKKHGKLCCTVNANSSGCLQPSLDRIKVYHIWFFITPSGFGLLCELVLAYYWLEVYRKRYPPQVNRTENYLMEIR